MRAFSSRYMTLVILVGCIVLTGAIIGGDDTVPVYAAFRHEVDRYNSNVSTTMRLDKVTHFVDVNNNVIVTRERERFAEIMTFLPILLTHLKIVWTSFRLTKMYCMITGQISMASGTAVL